MNKEDIQFLKDLQNEMLTQDHVCQADPRFWVVMQTVRDYWVDDNIDGISIYDTDGCDTVFEGSLEELPEWLNKNFDCIKSCEYGDDSITFIFDDEDEYYISDIQDIKEFLDNYAYEQYSVCYYRDRNEIVENTMFLTLKECKEHIEANHYHYNNPRSYAMTVWRSPQVERLYKILQNTEWDELGKGGD